MDIYNMAEYFEGALCEIRNSKNKLISIGTINRITENFFEILSYNDLLPILPINTPIKISTRRGKHFIIVQGKIYISSESKMKLTEIESLQEVERRNFFRVNTNNIPTQLMYINDTNKKPDQSKEPIPVYLENISLSGLLFSPVNNDVQFTYKQEFIINMPIHKQVLQINIIIERIEIISEQNTKYGCSFSFNDDKQTDLLCSYIFTKEREMLNDIKNLH